MAIQEPVKKTKWQVKREASYQALVESAMRSFHDNGYEATRIEDISADAGYTSGAFYFHFQNKADCFWNVIAHREGLRGDWVTNATSGLDPKTATLETVLARTFQRFAQADGGRSDWVLAMVDFHQQHKDDPEIATLLAHVYKRWHENIARFVTALQHGGWVAADRDPNLLATQVFAATEGLTTHARLYSLDTATTRGALFDMLGRLLTGPA
jgi:AcrR family transcriptional regulator